MYTIVSLSYFLLMFMILAREVRIIKRTHKINILSLCNIFFSLLICGTSSVYYWNPPEKYSYDIVIFGLLLTNICFLFFQIGYNSCRFKSRFKRKQSTTFKHIWLFSICLLLISGASLYLYASGYGGIENLMMSGNLIRASNIQSENSYTFFKHFIPVSIITTLLIYNVVFIRKQKTTKYVDTILGILFLFIPSFVISLIYIVANDGRMMAGVYFLFFVLIWIRDRYESGKVSLRRMAIIGSIWICIGGTAIIGSEKIMSESRGVHATETASENSFREGIIKEFSFIVKGENAAISYINYDIDRYMIANDLVNGIFAWLPTSLKPIKLTDVWDFNTNYIDSSTIGQSPTSIVAQSYYDLGLLGVVLIPLLWGRLIHFVEFSFGNDKNVFISTVYTISMFYFAKSIPYFSLYNIMMNVFFIVLAFIVYRFLNN